ncbi:MAG: hypothetical protein QG641_1163, partial [Candidatus Poribacteria bacterium]|nr:hypothetical protein [Candidatus Poribacteria bacterium]
MKVREIHNLFQKLE